MFITVFSAFWLLNQIQPRLFNTVWKFQNG